MQRDFCSPSGSFFVGDDAVGCIPNVQSAVEAARSAGLHVIWIVREHDPSGIDVEKFRVPFFEKGKVGGVVTGSPGADFVNGLRPRTERAHDGQTCEIVIVKKRFSAFFQTHLDLVLRRLGVRRLVLCGVQTPNCIRATAYDAVSLDYDVAVLADATASATKEVQQANLYDMKNIGVRTWTGFNADWAVSMLNDGWT